MSNEKLLEKYGNMSVIDMMKMIERQAAVIEKLESEKSFANEYFREQRRSEDRRRGEWGIFG